MGGMAQEDRMDDGGPSDEGREWKKPEKRGTSTRLTLFRWGVQSKHRGEEG